jgi:hypothetical protein
VVAGGAVDAFPPEDDCAGGFVGVVAGGVVVVVVAGGLLDPLVVGLLDVGEDGAPVPVVGNEPVEVKEEPGRTVPVPHPISIVAAAIATKHIPVPPGDFFQRITLLSELV